MFIYYITSATEINPSHGGSYIDSPNWIKSKKAAINPSYKYNNKCFQQDEIF